MILSSCLKQIFSTILRKVPFMPSSLLRIKFILPSSGELVVFKCLGVSQVFLHTTFHCSIGYFCIMSDIAELFKKKILFLWLCTLNYLKDNWSCLKKDYFHRSLYSTCIEYCYNYNITFKNWCVVFLQTFYQSRFPKFNVFCAMWNETLFILTL